MDSKRVELWNNSLRFHLPMNELTKTSQCSSPSVSYLIVLQQQLYHAKDIIWYHQKNLFLERWCSQISWKLSLIILKVYAFSRLVVKCDFARLLYETFMKQKCSYKSKNTFIWLDLLCKVISFVQVFSKPKIKLKLIKWRWQ